MRAETHLGAAFAAAHPDDAARVLERLGPAAAAGALEGMATEAVAGVIGRLVSRSPAELLARMPADRAQAVLAALPADVAAAALRRADPDVQATLLAALEPEAARAVTTRLRHPEDSAVALADPRVITLPDDVSAGEALARVKRASRSALYYLYVLDRAQRLVGVLNLRELLMAPPRAPLASVMRRDVVTVAARARRADIVTHAAWQAVHALPVVDDGGVFLGVLRYETLRALERDAESSDAASSALATVLTLGELCWVGLTGVFVDLASTVAAPGATGAGEGVEHGRDR